MKISFHPEKGSLKLDNFYIIDPEQRGQGIGKTGLRNIYNLASQEEKIKEIHLTATLDNGAYVWAKLGFKPLDGDFARFQKVARKKLHDLQDVLPEGSKIDTDIFEMVDRLLDAEKTKDPRAIWALADMGVMLDHSYNNGKLEPIPKKLSFVLMEWAEYRAKLDLNNAEQKTRIEAALGIKEINVKTYENSDTLMKPVEVIKGKFYEPPKQQIL